MFATQQYLEAVDAGRKRFRDDEEIANAAAGFGEHRNVRLPLPCLSSLPCQYGLAANHLLRNASSRCHFETPLEQASIVHLQALYP